LPLDPDTFRSVLGRFASGVTIVTTRDAAGEDHGMTVSAFCSLSLTPPLVLVCIEHSATMHDAIRSADAFAVSILASGQEALSRRFSSPESSHRFDGIGYSRGANGAPLIDDALAHIECRRIAHHPGGDHSLVIGEVVAATAYDERPLLYYRGGYAQLER
jgi:flavin reductase (DIM6/NTAB) family NADH-FMN oxidoreductase RutF